MIIFGKFATSTKRDTREHVTDTLLFLRYILHHTCALAHNAADVKVNLLAEGNTYTRILGNKTERETL